MSNLNIAESVFPRWTHVRKSGRKNGGYPRGHLPTVFGERVTLRLLEQTERTISLEELGVAPEI